MKLQGCVNGGVYPITQKPCVGKTAIKGSARTVERDDGRVWPSVVSATADAGVSESRLRYAIRSGRVCAGHRWHYLGEEWRERPNPTNSPVPIMRKGDGKEWPSIRACAEEIGVRPERLRDATMTGREIDGERYARKDL